MLPVADLSHRKGRTWFRAGREGTLSGCKGPAQHSRVQSGPRPQQLPAPWLGGPGQALPPGPGETSDLGLSRSGRPVFTAPRM